MRFLIVLIALLGGVFVSCSQDLPVDKVPSVILNAFQTRFTDARDVDWEKEGPHYEAEFERGASHADHKVLIDSAGAIVMYKYDITSNELPALVLNAIQANYKDYKIDEVETLEKDGATYYQVELEKTLKQEHLVFAADGALNNNIKYWD